MGMGRIGTEFAKRCVGAYGMKVLYHNRSQMPDSKNNLNATYVSFEELLQKSDILSVHCSLTERTKEKFNSLTFAKMKPSSIFINTARGGIHNENDLIEALQNNVIWGPAWMSQIPSP